MEILRSALNGYNKILAADISGEKPLYRPKEWKSSARWLGKRRKARCWLGDKYKSSIFVPPTPNSELRKLMQSKEVEMRDDRKCWKNFRKILIKYRPL